MMNHEPNKYDLINSLIVQVNDLVDLRGVDKCAATIEIVRKLNMMERILKGEDSNHEAAIKELTNKIDKLEAAGKDDADA